MDLTESQIELLLSAVTVGEWYVNAENLVDAGSLVASGYAKAVDAAYEGPQIVPTDKARNALRARGLIKLEDPQNPWRGWTRTSYARA